ncbi:MAG: class I SAM-dependent methyltransferase [Candidatus Diapherotrites archaeon]
MDRTNSQKEFFDRQSAEYEMLYGDESELEREIVEKRRTLVKSSQPAGIVLDLGTGTGTHLGEISGKADAVIALDISPQMIALASRRAENEKLRNVSLVIADAQSLPFKEGAFDAVYCINAFYHVPDRGRALSEMRRVMRRGAFAILEFYSILNPMVFARVVVNYISAISSKRGFVYAEFPPAFRATLSRNGFTLEGGSFSALSYVETSEAVRQWLPEFAFRILSAYRRISERHTFLRPPKMRCAAKISKR